MRRALRLARRGYGMTSPNPMVGALLVKADAIIGQGWHPGAGQPHAEIEALHDASSHGHSARGATLYVTLEPCCTFGRTPPCTEAIIRSGIRRVVAGTTDPNPIHSGKGFRILKRAGLAVTSGILAEECANLNEAFNYWISQRLPFVTVKSAMTLDGKIATQAGQSKWITSPASRAYAMHLRQGADAILVGINTILADNPSLTFRPPGSGESAKGHGLRRIVVDARARTPLTAKIVADKYHNLTTIVVGKQAPQNHVAALAERVRVLVAPSRDGKIDLPWLLRTLGKEQVTSLLVEGGGEVSASFLFAGLAQKIAFFYAPKILGGGKARKAVVGQGAKRWDDIISLTHVQWRQIGPDWLMMATVAGA